MSIHPALARTMTALLVAGGLWAVIYFYEYKGEAGRLEARAAESRAFSMDEDAISGVEIMSSGDTTALLREETGWTITRPVETRADEDKVRSLLSAATGLQVDQKLEDIPESELGDFSLQEPSARVILTSGAEQRAELVFGDRVPVSSGYYAMKAGEPAVLVVTGGVESLTSASLDSLRYKKIVGVDLWGLSGFTIAAQGGDLRVTREADAWRIREPVSFPADSAKIRDLWSGLAWLEAGGVAVEKPAPEDLGRMHLDPAVLELSLEAGEDRFSVGFGGTDESGAVFVRRSDLDAVMTVPKETLDRLEEALRKVDDLRDARVAPVDRFRLSRIEISGAGSPRVLIKDEGSAWRIDGAEGGEAAPEGVESFLDAVEELRAGAFVEGVPDESRELTLTFTERGENEGAENMITTVHLLVDGAEASGDRRMLSTVAPSTLYMVSAINVLTLIDRVAALGEPGDAVEPAVPE